LDPESPKDVQCEHCGLYFRNDGIRPHEQHCNRRDKDPFQPIRGESEPRDEPQPEESDPTPDSEGVTASDGESPGQAVETREPATEGGTGPMEPPTPTVEPATDDSDELPERYVEIDDYLEAARERGLSEEQISQLRDSLEEYDLVDTQTTTAESVTALNMEDVR